MESMDYLTKGDLALFEHYNNGNMPYYGCYKHRDNVATTGIGLAAGLGGAALLGIFAIGWGLNQASKARANEYFSYNKLFLILIFCIFVYI